MSETRSIAFFDFDGTITSKDTLFEFIKFTHGKPALLKGLIVTSPWLVGLKTGIISAAVAKEKVLSHFYKGIELEIFEEKCRQFSNTVLPSLVRKDAYAEIQQHRNKGTEVVVVSASAENWIGYWCRKENIRYIGTKLCVDGNKLTGTIEGFNCNGAEKVSRIKAMFDPADYDEIYAYGDSKGDREMLELATHPYFRYFKS